LPGLAAVAAAASVAIQGMRLGVVLRRSSITRAPCCDDVGVM
jgi:hypothetical protein